jgi:protein required for attachment to host cells
MKEIAWVVVANGSKARIFASNGSQKLEEVEVLEHPETRVHGRDLVSGKPGRSFDSVGGGRHSLEAELSPQKNEAHHFAAHLANHLEHARRTNGFTKLYLIASPAFLGSLRSVLHAPIKDLIALEVDKDATSKTLEEIKVYLPIRL